MDDLCDRLDKLLKVSIDKVVDYNKFDTPSS